MDREIYNRLDQLQDRHWWFCARREIIRQTLKLFVGSEHSLKILEAGCGTGGNFSMLSDFGDVVAFEPNRDAVEMAAAKGDYSIVQGALPDQVPLDRDDFELIVALDVIEHVEFDIEGLAALRKMLKPGGKLLLTVPAFPFLWSAHDRTHHHYRRYTRRSLVDIVNAAGYEPVYVTHYNFLLFPIVAATRFLKNWLAVEDTGDDRMPAKVANFMLRAVFSAERHWIGRVTMPFGVSLLVVAANPG